MIVGRRRELESRCGGTDPHQAKCHGTSFADASHDRLCGRDVDGKARSMGVDAISCVFGWHHSIQES